LQLFFVVALWLTEQFVALAGDDQGKGLKFVLADIVVEGLGVGLAWFSSWRRWFLIVGLGRITGLRSFALAGLVLGKPFDVDGLRAAPLFFFNQPLSPFVPGRAPFRVDVTERAVLRSELPGFDEQGRI